MLILTCKPVSESRAAVQAVLDECNRERRLGATSASSAAAEDAHAEDAHALADFKLYSCSVDEEGLVVQVENESA